VLAQMTPLITDAQAKGTIGAAWLTTQQPRKDIALGISSSTSTSTGAGGTRCRRWAMPSWSRSAPTSTLSPAATCNPFHAQHAGTGNCGLGPVETGKFVNGKWIPGRRVNGDDVVLEYDQAAAAAKNQSGSGLIFGGDGPTIQHVKLYRYR